MLVFLLSIAHAATEVPNTVAAWADRLEALYAHYEHVDLAWGPDSEVGPQCGRPEHGVPLSLLSARDDALQARYDADPQAFFDGCLALRHTAWELRVDLKPKDRRVFSPAKVRVLPVAGGQDAAEVLRKAVEYGAIASKASQALIASGDVWVELTVPCGSMAMFAYEADDLVTALGDVTAPIAWSECGQAHYELKTKAWLSEEADKPREFWGLPFPEARDRARKQEATAE